MVFFYISADEGQKNWIVALFMNIIFAIRPNYNLN